MFYMTKKQIVAGLMLLLLCLTVAGCTDNQKKNAALTEQKALQKEEGKPVNGGTMIIGSTQDPLGLDPIAGDSLAASQVAGLLFNGLIGLDDKLSYYPELAASVPTVENGGISQDGTIVTYKLRQGVTWHDGQPFTSDDVRFTYGYLKKSAAISSFSGLYNSITSLECPDANTVVVNYQEYRPDILLAFPYVLPAHLMRSQAQIKQFALKPIGTGPYRFVAMEPGKELKLAANTKYFAGRAHIDNVVYKVFTDYPALYLAIRGGDVDLSVGIPEDEISRLANQTMHGEWTAGLDLENISLNQDKPIFQDVAVRQAINYALDKRQIIDQAYNGSGVIADSVMPPNSWAFDESQKSSGFNPDIAGKLLAQAGWTDSDGDKVLENGRKKLRFELSYTENDPARLQAANLIRDQLAAVGFEVDLQPVLAERQQGDLNSGRYDAAIVSYRLNPDLDQTSLWQSTQTPPDGFNITGYNNPEVDGICDYARKSPALHVKRDAYIKLQQILKNDMPVVPLLFRGYSASVSGSLHGYAVSVRNEDAYKGIVKSWLKK